MAVLHSARYAALLNRLPVKIAAEADPIRMSRIYYLPGAGRAESAATDPPRTAANPPRVAGARAETKRGSRRRSVHEMPRRQTRRYSANPGTRTHRAPGAR